MVLVWKWECKSAARKGMNLFALELGLLLLFGPLGSEMRMVERRQYRRLYCRR